MIPNKKYQVNENYFNKINTEEKAYWLGFLYADGSVRLHKERSGILRLKLKNSDKDHIEKFNKCLESNYPIKERIEIVQKNNKKYNCYCSFVNIYNTKIVKDLYNIGCVNNKTQKIRLPKLDSNVLSHFIRGYFDGDGCISKIKQGYNCYTITIVSNKCFIYDLKNFLEHLFNINLTFKDYKNYSILSIYNRKDREIFYHYIYDNATIFLNRKKEIFDDMMDIKDIDRKTINIKKYKIIDPHGNVFLTKDGLKSFCRENDLNYSNINNVLRGTTKNYKGWKIEHIQ